MFLVIPDTQQHKYFRLGAVTFKIALMIILLQAFDSGEVFPIWAECLGFELVSMLVSKTDISSGQLSTEFFISVDAENISLPLILPRGMLAPKLSKSTIGVHYDLVVQTFSQAESFTFTNVTRPLFVFSVTTHFLPLAILCIRTLGFVA